MTTAFSDEHEVALSNIFEARIFRAASARSAVSSMITGTLPAPTPIAGVPLIAARRTLSSEPVTTTRSAAFISASIESLVTGYLSSSLRDAAAFFVLIGVLYFRPNGLFGSYAT